MSYEGADIFLLFFSVVNPTSYDNVKEKVVAKEISSHFRECIHVIGNHL
jgi:hypothetical protein